MNSFGGMKEVAGGARGGEGRRNLLGNDARLADAAENDVACATVDKRDSLGKTVIEVVGQRGDGLGSMEAGRSVFISRVFAFF